MGIKFYGNPQLSKDEQAQKALDIIRSLEHESYLKMTTEHVDQAIEYLRAYPQISGVMGKE